MGPRGGPPAWAGEVLVLLSGWLMAPVSAPCFVGGLWSLYCRVLVLGKGMGVTVSHDWFCGPLGEVGQCSWREAPLVELGQEDLVVQPVEGLGPP